jgi:uncharacterized protein
MAEDRGYDEIAQFLKQSLADPKLTRAWGDTGKIDYGKDEIQRRFQELVGQNKRAEVEALLQERPGLALDETAFWGEGILAMPAKDGDRRMLELLMRYGARVPDVSKWGALLLQAPCDRRLPAGKRHESQSHQLAALHAAARHGLHRRSK